MQMHNFCSTCLLFNPAQEDLMYPCWMNENTIEYAAWCDLVLGPVYVLVEL